MPQIRFDLELRRKRKLQSVAQRAAELLRHLLVGQIRDVPDHSRHAQAASRQRVVLRVVAVVKIRIGQDGLPRHFVERDVLCGQVGRCGNHQCIADALGIAHRPRQCLHAAEAAAHHRRKLRDAESISQTRLRVDPVLDRYQREVTAPRSAGGGIDRHRSGGSEATAEVVDAHDEKTVGIKRLARPDHVVPPAHALGIVAVHSRHVMRRVQRMAHQHGVRCVGVELAVGFVREFVFRQPLAARQRQRFRKACDLGLDGPERAAGSRGKGGHGGF